MRFNLSGWALRHGALTRYFMLLALAVGAWSYTGLGQRDMPRWTVRTMILHVQWPGASAQELAGQVVDKIERKLQETPNLEAVTSTSLPGEAYIQVNLSQHFGDVERVAQTWYQVRKKVYDIRDTLPPGVRGPYFNDEFSEIFPLIYAVWGDEFSPAEQRRHALLVRQALLRVSGVEKVDLLGERPEQVHVDFDTARLAALGITPLAIAAALDGRGALAPGGSVESAGGRVRVRVADPLDSAQEVAATPVRAPDGRVVTVGELARVRPGYQEPPRARFRFQGHDAIGLAVSARDGTNVLAVRRDVEATLARVRTALPVGLALDMADDEPQVVAHTLGVFLRKLALAVGIVLAVSYFTLGLRAGLVVATAFPLTLALTFAGMRLLGVDLQRISLGALIISLGLLVDDAIIIIEMMLVKLREGLDRFEAATAAFRTTSVPMLTGTLVTVAGFMPMALSELIMREFMYGMYVVIAIALLASWLVSVLFTPYLAYHLLPHVPRTPGEVYDTRFYRALRALVATCVRRRGWVLAGIGALLAATAAGFRLVDQQFFPYTDRPDLIVELWHAEGATHTQVMDSVAQAERALLAAPGVRRVVGYVGMDSPRIFSDLYIERPFPNLAKLYVHCADLATRDALVARVNRDFPALLPQTRVRASVYPFGIPVPAPLEYRVIGPDAQRLAGIADQVRRIVASYPGAHGLHTDWRGGVPVVRVTLDHARAAALGVDAAGLARALDLLLAGRPVAQVRRGEDTVDVVVRLGTDERTRLAWLAALEIPLPAGGSVPLAQLAHLRLEVEEGVVARYNRAPAISVRAYLPPKVEPINVDRALRGELDALRATLPVGYHVDAGGTVEASEDVRQGFAAVVPVIGIVIFTLLMFQLHSFGLTLMTAATAPLGLIGAVFMLLAVDLPLGFVASLGLLALAGVIIRNTVILVDQIRQDVEAGVAPHEAVVGATVRRFRPIAVTAVAAVLALVPLTTDPFWSQMAYAMIGGLAFATVLTVLGVPALYAAVMRIPRVVAPEPGR
jgi:multidrug efflux pump